MKNHKSWIRLLIGIHLLILTASSVNAATVELGVAGDLKFEKGDLLKETIHPERMRPPSDWQTQSGAIGLNRDWELNKSLPWHIEIQMYGGFEYISSGIAFENKDMIKYGLKAFKWGFDHMADDGEFKHHDSYNSASFFIENVAHSLLLLESDPIGKDFSQEIEMMKPKLHAAAKWMTRPDIHNQIWENPKSPQLIYGCRRFLVAAALGETGLLLNDQKLIAKSISLVIDGIAAQRADGVNIEKGGSDTHYQSLGLVMACRYYSIVASDTLRKKMKPMLEKGFAWFYKRINADGTINISENTRTGPNLEKKRDGKPKVGFYTDEVRSCAEWGFFTGNLEYEKAARLMYDAAMHLKTEKQSDKSAIVDKSSPKEGKQLDEAGTKKEQSKSSSENTGLKATLKGSGKITFKEKDGSTTSISDVQVISVKDGMVVIEKNGRKRSFSLNQVSSFTPDNK
jgi:hypothetical protein